MLGRMRATVVTGKIVTAIAVALDRSSFEGEDFFQAARDLIESEVAAVLAAHGATPATTSSPHYWAATFPRPSDAFPCATALRDITVGDEKHILRVGIHAGDRGDALIDDPVTRAARLSSLARGGQVLLSRATGDLVRTRLPSGLELIDLGPHRPRDLGRSENVLELRSAGWPELDGALLGLDLVANNLPTQLTSFVGRGEQLTALRRTLHGVRVLTITGPGGCGKTRLALQLAGSAVDAYAGGVWVADLGPIAEPGLVASAVAEVLGVGEIPNKALEQVLAEHLGSRQILLVLDNCEHLVEACAPFVEMLIKKCPGLTIVPTSREPLGCDGEVTWRVPSLALPAEGDVADAESVRLFVDRACAARPTFILDEANAEDVAEVCRQLDGIPLAIELAAALARALTPREIATQLADRFALLTGGRRGGLPRHRTLEASVDWSYGLLSEDERVLLRRLGVFAAGFEFRAAEAVTAGDGLERWSVLTALTGLVDRSLALLEDEAGEGRYRLLETIRQYALGKLVEAGEVARVRDRHLAYFLDRAEDAEPLLEGSDMLAVLATLDVEVDNIRAALDWALQANRGEDGLRLASALWLFWQRHRSDEGATRLRAALDASDGDGDPLHRAAAWQALADLSFYSGDVAGARQCCETALGYAEAAGDDRAIGRAVNAIGYTGVWMQEPEAAAYLERALVIHRAVGDGYYAIDSLSGINLLAWYEGDPARMRAASDEALALARQTGNPQMVGRALLFASLTATTCGEIGEAVLLTDECVDGCAELQDELMGPWAVSQQAYLQFLRGDGDEALVAIAAAHARANAHNNLFGMLAAQWYAALVERDLGHPGAMDSLTEVAAIAGAFNIVPWAAKATSLAVERSVAAGDLAWAATAVDEIRQLVEASNGKGSQAWPSYAAAQVAAATDDLERATTEVHEALAAWVATSDRIGIVLALELLVDLDVRGGRHVEAARLLGAADADRRRQGWVVAPADAGRLAANREALVDAMGDEVFAAALAEGASMELKEAVAYARRGRGARRKSGAGWTSLTATELEVVRLAAEGLRNNDIAERLFISPVTVKSHLSHAFTKLGVRNRAELVAYALPRLAEG